MVAKNPRIIMSFASLGSYRLNTMRLVKQHFGDSIMIYSGDRAPDPSIRLVDPADLDHLRLRNRILKKSVVLQNIPLSKFLRCHLLLMDLNPRMPLVWLVVVLRRALGKRTLLWGHAFPRSGRNSRSEVVRAMMRKLSSGIVAYTRSQAQELRELHPALPIWSAPNALYAKRDFYFDESSNRDAFIYVGRLHVDKKPLLMVNAFEQLWKLRKDLRLVIVGDGPLSDEIRQRVKESPAVTAIQLAGHVEEYESLRELYSHAIASISPGYVGLSVTQSLSFGVPMIISRSEPHAPELEAVEIDVNGLFFETDNVEHLSKVMLELAKNAELWHARGAEIAETCAASYSVEAMVAGLVDALEDRRP
jgi:glycosyltransferase involved in cell wall biosynthesis